MNVENLRQLVGKDIRFEVSRPEMMDLSIDRVIRVQSPLIDRDVWSISVGKSGRLRVIFFNLDTGYHDIEMVEADENSDMHDDLAVVGVACSFLERRGHLASVA